MRGFRSPRFFWGLFFCLFLVGCTVNRTDTGAGIPSGIVTESLASGVVHRAVPTGVGRGIDVIDVDLTRAATQIAIETQGLSVLRPEHSLMGEAHTPREWLERTQALAAINGGYFGAETPDGGKEFVGLLIKSGRVRHAAPPLFGHGGQNAARGYYVRSAFGVLADGRPSIVWAGTASGDPQGYAAYSSPLDPHHGQPWPVMNAVGCGPMLISGGQMVLTDREERLVSPDPLPRTFVAYDGSPGHPHHFVFGIASSMTYADLAAFLHSYFPQYDRTQAEAAMCLDGGASTQLSFRQGGAIQSPRDTGVAVPDAIVLIPAKKRSQ